MPHLNLQMTEWHRGFKEIFNQKEKMLPHQFQVLLSFIKSTFSVLGVEDSHLINSKVVWS